MPTSSSSRRAASPTARWVAALERTAPIARRPERTLPEVIDELGEEFADRPALIGVAGAYSHDDLRIRSRQVGHWAASEGIGAETSVGLLMPNSPDYVALWVGLIRTGATVALVNPNLSGASLAHAIDLVGPKLVIADAGLSGRLAHAAPFMAARPRIWAWGGDTDHPRLDLVLAAFDGDRFKPSAPVTLSDRALCIYTSGTTGLPKAANVSHHRLMMWAHWFAGLLDTKPSDRLYNCLPMYHSVGGVIAPFAPLLGGGSVVVRQRFSAREFWDDIVRTECTLFQYIGELCRYLVQAPSHPLERAHRLRLAVGNGLRPDVWEAFRDRFAIAEILEFYAATEGTVSLYNVEGRIGAVGRVPPFLAHRSPAVIVKLDEGLSEPRRDEQGRCIRCGPGEPGELIGRAAKTTAHAQSFEGYTSREDSARKLIRDVFEPGDCWFRTSDLMRTDGAGFFYFLDRLGDTFRWKGENTSTTEVAEAIGRAPGVARVAVYGVAVPGADGRAGMAAVLPGADFDLGSLHDQIVRHLPSYAQPVFLRVVPDLDSTDTHKLKTQELKEQGFDPARITDPLFCRDAATGSYLPLDLAMYHSIVCGDRRL